MKGIKGDAVTRSLNDNRNKTARERAERTFQCEYRLHIAASLSAGDEARRRQTHAAAEQRLRRLQRLAAPCSDITISTSTRRKVSRHAVRLR